VLLADESSGFIKDKESWDLCQKERSDVVEAFGLYIEVMLARQSHRQELKRVFGKEGIQIIHKMQATSEADPESYKAALSICRQRLVLDTLNFVLGVGVMGAIAFTLSASLALPLLAKISKGSPNFEYMNFVMKTFVLGSIVFTPHGLLALTLFSLGFSIHSLVTGGKSKLPFMKSEDLDNYTRWDKLLIQFNIILAALSIFSTGFMGLYVDVPLRATAALAATQVPWLGLNMYGLSEIWKREEAKRAEIRGKIASELVNAKEEGLNIFIKSLLDQYEFESIRQAFLTTPGVQAVQGFETKSGIKRMLDISKTEHEEALAKDLKSEITGYFRALDNAGLIKARETRQTDRWPSTSTLEERNAQAHNELATRRKEHDQAISNIRGVISAAGANSNWEKLMLEHGAPLISQVLEDFESRQDYQEIRKKFTEIRSRTKRRR
jgi:hypothetical protein